MALKTRVWTAGKLVVLAGGLIATYLVFAAGAMRFALKTREVEVPDLRNHTANEASALTADLGLTVKVDESQRVDQLVPAGHIISQEPVAGSTTRRPRSIRVWLSAGAHVAAVPSLVGDTARAAELELGQDGLTLGNLAEITSAAYPPDTVVAQSPPPASAGAQVSLLVNRPGRGASFVMPDLIGVNGESRRRHSSQPRLPRGRRRFESLSGGARRASSSARARRRGFRIAPGEPISLEVSR